MTDLLTPEQLAQIADHVRRQDAVARIPQSPKSTLSPDGYLGRIGAMQEAARLERRRVMDEANARQRARARASARIAQADADDARRQLAGLASEIERREAERREVDAKATELYRRDRDKHGAFDAQVKDLQARAAAVPPRKEQDR